MDDNWAIQVLEWWAKNATEARQQDSRSGRVYDWAWTADPAVIALREREDQTRRVLARVMGLQNLPVLLDPGASRDSVYLMAGVDLCRYAVGRIRTDAETRAQLGTNAPTMAADAMHPLVWEAASGRWDAGHYADAVQRAATFLNAEIQDRVSRTDVADSALMSETFSLSPPVLGKSRLRYSGDDTDLTVRAMRVGILNYAQGVYSAIRNPATHSTDNLARQEALEQLAALSLLARWAEQCELVTI